MLNTRSVRLALGGLAVLLLIAVAWCAWTAWKVNQDLQDAVAHGDALQQAIEDGDDAAIDRELSALEKTSASADDRTSGPTWSFLTHVPVFGDDANGVRTVSKVVHDLANDGLKPLVQVQDQLPGLLPKDGTIALDNVAGLEAPIADASEAFHAASDELAAEDTSGYMGQLRSKYDDLDDKVQRAMAAMDSAQTALALLPTMLGEDGDRHYLLVFENNAEIRATGGLPGSVAVLDASDGKLTLDRQVPVSTIPRAQQPVLPWEGAERKLYDTTPALYFQSSNMIPDVPRIADLMRARWEQEFPNDQVDGVVLVDTVALSYVLDATGPITVDGVELTSDNLVEELINKAYIRLDSNKAQDAFFNDVAEAAFSKFTAGAANPTSLLSALARATSEGRIYLHSFDEAEQQQLSGTTIAGEFVTDADVKQPQINVTVNDTTASKMSYYLRYHADVGATYCQDGVQGFRGTMRVSSEAPADAATSLPAYITGPSGYTEPGGQYVTMRIFGPAGGTLGDLMVNAKPIKPISVDQDGRPVAMFFMELKPGQAVDLEWTMKSGPGQTGDARLDVTPGVEPVEQSGTVHSAC